MNDDVIVPKIETKGGEARLRRFRTPGDSSSWKT